MSGRNFNDDAELRPFGEATHVPDDVLNTNCRNRHRDPRQSCSSADDGPARECRSCGASTPTGRTKCRFCLSNHVEPLNVDDIADETALLHVIHMVVPAASQYAAVAKGTTAASLVPRNDGTITSCDLVAELDDEPAQQLVNQWGVLPAAVRASAETGQRLVATARERTPGIERRRAERPPSTHIGFRSTLGPPPHSWSCSTRSLTQSSTVNRTSRWCAFSDEFSAVPASGGG